MDYTSILKEIKPTLKEKKEIFKIANSLIDYINLTCEKENIQAKAILVGSVAKETFLRGKSDIDIFLCFSLDTPINELKEKGLYLGYKCSDKFNGIASEHYASHPYVTSLISNFEVDFVPCYNISDSSQLKSAVDRTILHTKYIQANLNEKQKDEVLLLKKFMDEIKTYGSEFKVGGFAGYLCELLILKYGTFENTLKNASSWHYGTVIDLEDYKTSKLFDDPLITIDPTDKNRNVGAALKLDKMGDFILASRNYLSSSNKESYFYPLKKDIDKRIILDEFKKRGTDLIAIKFTIPNIPLDTLHPQLKKTVESLSDKLCFEDFSVFKSSYWTDEVDIAILLLEMSVSKLNNIKVHYGPKIFDQKPSQNFINAHGKENCYVINDFLVLDVYRKFTKAEDLVRYILKKENISLIKVGKNLKEPILNSYELISFDSIDDKDYLNFLDDYLYPNKYLNRE